MVARVFFIACVNLTRLSINQPLRRSFLEGKQSDLNGTFNATLRITTGLKPTLKQTVKYVELKRSVLPEELGQHCCPFFRF